MGEGLVPGAVVGLAALAVGVLLAVLTVRFARGRSIVTAMIQTSFLPEKRQRFLFLISLQGAVVLLIAIVWGLTSQGWIPSDPGNTLTAALLIAATATVGSLTWLGYAPTRLTPDERRSLALQAPEVFQSLVMAPLLSEGTTTEFAGRSRPRVRPVAAPSSERGRPPQTPPPAG